MLEDGSMVVHTKKAFLLLSVLPGAEYTWVLHLKEELTDLF